MFSILVTFKVLCSRRVAEFNITKKHHWQSQNQQWMVILFQESSSSFDSYLKLTSSSQSSQDKLNSTLTLEWRHYNSSQIQIHFSISPPTRKARAFSLTFITVEVSVCFFLDIFISIFRDWYFPGERTGRIFIITKISENNFISLKVTWNIPSLFSHVFLLIFRSDK